MIYNDLKAIKTNLAEVCPPAHELLIKVLTTGFKAQVGTRCCWECGMVGVCLCVITLAVHRSRSAGSL